MTTTDRHPQPLTTGSDWYRPWSPLRNGRRSFDPGEFICPRPDTGRYRVGHYTDERLRLVWLELLDLDDTASPPVGPPTDDWANHDGVVFGCPDCARAYCRAVVSAGHSRYGWNPPPTAPPA